VSKCPICASENGPNDRFCRVCGAAFTVRPSALTQQVAVEAPGAGAAATVAALEVEPPVAAAAAAPLEPQPGVGSEPAPAEEPPAKPRRSAWMVMVVVIPLMLLCGACFVISLIGRML